MFNNLYLQRKSPIHQLNFWTKFLCFSLILPLASFICLPRTLPVIAAFLLSLLFLSRINLRQFWNLTKQYVVALSVGIIVLSLAFSLGSFMDKVLLGLVLSARFILLVCFGIFFTTVTNPIEIPAGFLQARIPHKYGITLMVGYRLMPLLSQKIQSIVDAQKARGARIGFSFGKLHLLPLTVFSLAIPVLHSTLEMSVRLSDALISRGYDPDGKITLPPSRRSAVDFFFLSLVLILLAVSFKI